MSFDIEKEDIMRGKRPAPKKFVSKLRQVDALTTQGKNIADDVRAIEVRQI
jgi:hypothetical protein